MSTPTDPVVALSTLLADTLPTAVARGFVAGASSAAVLDDLSGPNVSHNQFCFEAAAALSRRGFVNVGLFVHLLAFAPGRHEAIAAVATLWKIDVTLAVELARARIAFDDRMEAHRSRAALSMWVSLVTSLVSTLSFLLFTVLLLWRLNSLENYSHDLGDGLARISDAATAVAERTKDLRTLQAQNQQLEQAIQELKVELARLQGPNVGAAPVGASGSARDGQ